MSSTVLTNTSVFVERQCEGIAPCRSSSLHSDFGFPESLSHLSPHPLPGPGASCWAHRAPCAKDHQGPCYTGSQEFSVTSAGSSAGPWKIRGWVTCCHSSRAPPASNTGEVLNLSNEGTRNYILPSDTFLKKKKASLYLPPYR